MNGPSGLPRGLLKSTPEDFIVEEIPAYPSSGEGDHVFVRFTKRGLTTDQALRAIAGALGVDPREAGAAGMKDKWAVTTQTVSLFAPRGTPADALAERARGLSLDGIVVHEAARHSNKLKPGHLAGNRFTIVVRGIPRSRLDEVTTALERIGRDGLPNAFGAQRFGNQKDNVERARAWLTGRAPAPRDPRMRRLLWSALQSAIFNDVLQARVDDGTWASALEGDLLKRRVSGGLFLCTDVQADRERATTGEVSPTGPMVGVKMRRPEGAPDALEQAKIAEILGENFDLGATKKLGEGTRRALRLWIEELKIEVLPASPPGSGVSGAPSAGGQTDGFFPALSPEFGRDQDAARASEARDDAPSLGFTSPKLSDMDAPRREQEASVRVYFVLPKGAYATTVLGAVLALEETRIAAEASINEGPDEAERGAG